MSFDAPPSPWFGPSTGVCCIFPAGVGKVGAGVADAPVRERRCRTELVHERGLASDECEHRIVTAVIIRKSLSNAILLVVKFYFVL